MRIWCMALLLPLSLCIVWEKPLCATWQDLLDQADSLVAIGNLDPASVIADQAMSEALSQYGKSDTTVEVCFYREGIPEYRYVHSYAEAESLYIRLTSLKEKILGSTHPGVAAILMDLASVYLGQRKYAEAKPLCERALAIREGAFGPDHPDVGRSLHGLGRVYLGLAAYDAAQSPCQRSLSILEQALGPEHPDVARSLNNLAYLYWLQGKYAEAEPLYRRALAILEQALGPEHPDVARSLANLAGLYRDQGEYAEAEPLCRRSLAILEQALGPEHPDVATCLYNLAGLYRDQGEYAEAEPLHRRALAIWEQALGPEHPHVAASLIGLAVLCYDQGKYGEAEPLFRRALAIWERALGPEHPHLATSLDNLASLYHEQGKYAEAEPLYRRSLGIREQALGSAHPEVAASLNNLANLYWRQGKYVEAEPLYRRSLAIWEQALGPEHPDVARSLNNLANLYNEQGKYAEAEPLFRRALAIWEQALGPEHPEVATSLNSLAGLYWDQGNYAEAEPLYRRSLAILEQALGPEHPRVAASLNNLANLYRTQGKYAEAELLYKRALGIWEQALGPEHPDVAPGLNNLAGLYTDQGKYPEAEPLFSRALAVLEQALGPQHPRLAECMEDFSRHCRLKGDPGKALEPATKAFKIREETFRTSSAVMSERDALTSSQFMRRSADGFLSTYFDLAPADASTAYTAADVIFSTKGRASETVFVRAAEMNMLAQLGALADSLRYARTRLSKLYVSKPGDDLLGHREQLDRAAGDKERFERELAMSNASYHNLQQSLYVTSREVIDVLKQNPGPATLIEYMKYNYYPADTASAIPHYLGLIMDRDSLRGIIDLGEASKIDELIDRYRSHILSVSSGGRWPTGVDQAGYREIGEALYEAIWEPIEGLIGEPDLVLIAPDGGLSMVSFAGLVDGEGTYLIERVSLHYLSSGRDLIRLKDAMEPARGLFALGDPDYNAPALARAGEQAIPEEPVTELAYAVTRNVRSGCGELNEMTVSPLPGTREEVELIAASWEESTREPVVVYFGSDASEERSKAEMAGKRVIHLATHGYFLEGACQPEPQRPGGLDSEVGYLGENPLLLSGLFLAGANLHGEDADETASEDGILTAEEVTAMNLAGTELVVLSACETGLGKVKEGEGVYGLRRAFQMAGARTVISALWPVSDEVTAGMMSQLYERKSQSIPETMRRIQLDKIRELRNKGQPDHPYTWGGFIALGDWR